MCCLDLAVEDACGDFGGVLCGDGVDGGGDGVAGQCGCELIELVDDVEELRPQQGFIHAVILAHLLDYVNYLVAVWPVTCVLHVHCGVDLHVARDVQYKIIDTKL